MSKLDKLQNKLDMWQRTATLYGSINVTLTLSDVVQLHQDVAVLYARIAELEGELAELKERFDITDGLLNQATVTIGAVIACCTYNSNEDAKIGIYGISPDAFTRIDQFITNYNHAVSAGKVSVDVKPVKRDLSDAEIEELGAAEAESRSGK